MQAALSVMTPPPERSEILGDPALRAALARFVGSRAPHGDVDDIVQSTLTDALAAKSAPDDAEQLRRWVFGIARHKVADLYRRTGREGPVSSPLDETVPAESAPLSARELLRWAERELPEGEHAENTLEWMMREAGGDKLESIAREESLPAPRVRQRVARMRRHFRERWALHAAVVAVLVLVAGGVAMWKLKPGPVDIAREQPSAVPGPEQRAVELRRLALEDCDASRWQGCLDRLDQAAELDPAGDRAASVTEARSRAAAGLAPAPSPEPEPAPPDSVEPQQAPIDNKAPTPLVPPQQTAPQKQKQESDKAAPAPRPKPAPKAKPAPKKAPKQTLSPWNSEPDWQGKKTGK